MLSGAGLVRLVGMEKLSMACVVVLAALVLGACGAGEEEPQAAAGTPAPKTKAKANAKATPEPAATGRASKASVRACLRGTGAELLDEGEAPPGGDPRLGLDAEGADYAGFVVWPSGTLADLYIATDGARAKRVATLYTRFLEKVGTGARAAKLVEPMGNVVVASDDERTPSAAETAELGCAFD